MEAGGARACPRCGAPASGDQEYCLECGYRLDATGGLVGTLGGLWRRQFGWYPGDWIWPVLFGLLIAIIGGIAAIVVADSGRGGSNPLVATHAGTPREPVAAPPTSTVSLPTVPRGTPTTTGAPKTSTTPPPPNKPAPAPGSLVSWPANRNGFTVVLESIPTSAGRGLGVARARAASRAGLPQVGVLNSSLYSSLHPGYYVVFSGIYGTKAQADAAARTASGKGFTSAYSREITR